MAPGTAGVVFIVRPLEGGKDNR